MKWLRIPVRTLYLLIVMLSGLLLAVLFLRGTMSPSGLAAGITRRWHSAVCSAFNIDVTVTGRKPETTVLIVANHISWFDITALGSVISARYLSKYEVVGWPVVGWLAKKAGTLFIRRGNRNAAQQSMEKMALAMRDGSHVVLFPEGTTTDGRSVRKFHSRLFQSAIDAGVDIQPVAIRYPHETGVHPRAPFINDITLYESAIGMLGEPHMKVEIEFLEPLTSTNRSRDELSLQCETLIRNAIEH